MADEYKLKFFPDAIPFIGWIKYEERYQKKSLEENRKLLNKVQKLKTEGDERNQKLSDEIQELKKSIEENYPRFLLRDRLLYSYNIIIASGIAGTISGLVASLFK